MSEHGSKRACPSGADREFNYEGNGGNGGNGSGSESDGDLRSLLKKELSSVSDRLYERLQPRFVAMEKRADAQDERIGTVEGRVAALETSVEKMSKENEELKEKFKIAQKQTIERERGGGGDEIL